MSTRTVARRAISLIAAVALGAVVGLVGRAAEGPEQR